MKYFVIIFILTLVMACNTTKVLTLKNKKYYTERNILTSNKTKKLIQIVSYSKPNVIDAGFTHQLSFIFIDTAIAKGKRELNFPSDSTILKCKYDITSVWNWEEENYTLTGNIEILKWQADTITLKENIEVKDINKNVTLKYKGKRQFIRHSNW